MCSSDVFLGVIAIFFPPLAVWVKCGICSADSVINILLCMLGWIPGLLHAWYIIAKFPDLTEYQPLDTENGGARVTYVYVQPGLQNQGPRKPQASGYGTTAAVAPPVHQEQSGGWSNTAAGEGSSAAPAAAPPSYAQAVKGDHKVQSNE